MPSIALRSISDHQLLSDTDAIAVQDRKLTLTLLVHLHEIERRKLYAKRGYSSMFDYCTTRLRLSEPSAARRIRTARSLARYPQLYPLLESGEVSLMSVSMISRLLKPENAGELIERIRCKSKREVEALVAEYQPLSVLPRDSVRQVVVPVPASATPPPQFTVTGDSEKSPNVQPAPLEPMSVVQFTARQAFMAKVDHARALLWHQFPNSTFEQVFELGLDALIAQRDPAERQKRREKRALKSKGASATAAAIAGKRYIRAAVRDQVFVRDGFRCSYVGPDGRRCTATVALQVDHVLPIARGGASTRDNLRVLCAEHNRLEAERMMGSYAPPPRGNSP
jgi:hypothetical protein